MDKVLIDLLFMSQKRKDVLLLLRNGDKTLEEIVELLQVNPTGMLPQIKKLKEENLVLQQDKKYKLTPLAEILVEEMEPLIEILEVIEKTPQFWQERDLSALPQPFLERLNELNNCSVIKPDPDNIFEPPAVFLENILNSRNILTFSSIFHPVFPELFLGNEDENTQITLIVTKRIYDRLKNDFEKELELYLGRGKKLFVCEEEIKIAMLIKTELFMSADFLTLKGAFDQETLVGFEPTSMKWAEDLILYYRGKAQEI